MIVYVPAIPQYLHDSVVSSVVKAGFCCSVCLVKNDSASYQDWFKAWWHASPQGFFIVEHDVEIYPASVTETRQNILEEMRDCDSSWCVSPYNDHHLLGCSKFIPRELKINWTVIQELSGPNNWETLDMAVSKSLRQFGYAPHIHRRATYHHKVRHLS